MECNQRNIKIILEDNVCDATDCIDCGDSRDSGCLAGQDEAAQTTSWSILLSEGLEKAGVCTGCRRIICEFICLGHC